MDAGTPIAIFVAILTLIMLILAWFQHQARETARMEQRLKTLHRTISKERHVFSEKAMDMYRDAYSSFQNNHIVAKEEWLSSELVPLSSISIRWDPKVPESEMSYLWKERKGSQLRIWRSENNIKRIKESKIKLPFNKLSYADNVKILTGKYVVTEPIYGLTGVTEKDGKKEIWICGGKYSDFYDTCDFMTYEIAHRMRIRKHPEKDVEMKDLLYRKSIDPFNLDNRFSGIGICTLTVLKNIEGYSKPMFLVHHRSSQMAEGGEAFHAVPAGSYEPVCTENFYTFEEVDGDPFNTIVREFLEEVVDSDLYNRMASVDWLKEMREKLYAEVFFVGIGFEPLNLKTELLACMVIDVDKSDIFREKSLDGLTRSLTKSYEGEVKIREFSKPVLEHYRNNLRSIPAFREILRFAIDHFDELSRPDEPQGFEDDL